MTWLDGFETRPTRAFVVHGEPDASDALSARMQDELGWSSDVVESEKTYDLGGNMCWGATTAHNTPVN